jgi:hypothetical protein
VAPWRRTDASPLHERGGSPPAPRAVIAPPVRAVPLLQPVGAAPRSRVGLWLLRLVALAFVAALLAATALVVADAV